MSAQRERPTKNPTHRTKPERIGQGVGGGRAERRVADTVTGRKQFFYLQMLKSSLVFFHDAASFSSQQPRHYGDRGLFLFFLQSCLQHTIVRSMTFYSLPFTPERTQATESRLEAIYEAAKYGLKGDSLAMAAGMTPRQFRVLAESDPLVEMAEAKGRSEGEYSAGKTMYEAARDGDSKAALEILKHQHGWVSKQQIDVNVDGQISVIAALEKAQTRVIQGLYTEVESAPTPSTLLTDQQEEFVNGYELNNARETEKSTDI